MAKRSKESYAIQSVLHALDLLEQFHGPDRELGVTELARRLGLHKNNVFRLLATLEVRGYVVQNPETEGYSLGVRALELGRSYLRHCDIVTVAEPLVSELRDETQETAHLAILQGEEVVFILSEESPQSVRVASRQGQHLPAFRHAAGKVQLAFLKELPHRQHPLRRLTDPRPSDLRRLERELVRIRKDGYGVDLGEADPDVTAIAAPVFDDQGEIVGALALDAPVSRAGADAVVRRLTEEVVAAAERVSRRLGFETPVRAQQG